MQKTELTFNDLPQVVAQLRDEVMGMREELTRQHNEVVKPAKAERSDRKPMTVKEAIDYTGLPKGTFYMKLLNGSIPAVKPGKRWLLFRDELDKWLEANRRGAVPLTAEEENDIILQSHRRKPNQQDWHD